MHPSCPPRGVHWGPPSIRCSLSTPVPWPTNDRASKRKPRGLRGLPRCAEEDSNLHGIYIPQGPQPRSACTMLPRIANGPFLCPVVSDPDVSEGLDVLNSVLTAVLRAPLDRRSVTMWRETSNTRRRSTTSSRTATFVSETIQPASQRACTSARVSSVCSRGSVGGPAMAPGARLKGGEGAGCRTPSTSMKVVACGDVGCDAAPSTRSAGAKQASLLQQPARSVEGAFSEDLCRVDALLRPARLVPPPPLGGSSSSFSSRGRRTSA